MFPNLRSDLDRIRSFKKIRGLRLLAESFLFDNGFNAVFLYRLAHWFKASKIAFVAPVFGRLSVLLTGAEISPGAEIGPGLMISHGQGIVIGRWARIGAHATLLHRVTLGGSSARKVRDMPTIGDNVFIGAGASLIGGILVGDDVFIGVNALVSRDVPAGSKVISTAGVEVLPPRGDELREGAESCEDVD